MGPWFKLSTYAEFEQHWARRQKNATVKRFGWRGHIEKREDGAFVVVNYNNCAVMYPDNTLELLSLGCNDWRQALGLNCGYRRSVYHLQLKSDRFKGKYHFFPFFPGMKIRDNFLLNPQPLYYDNVNKEKRKEWVRKRRELLRQVACVDILGGYQRRETDRRGFYGTVEWKVRLLVEALDEGALDPESELARRLVYHGPVLGQLKAALNAFSVPLRKHYGVFNENTSEGE